MQDDADDLPDVTIGAPRIAVLAWTLHDLKDGNEFQFRDEANPDLGYEIRVWVEAGSMYASITNVMGRAQTETRRLVVPPLDVKECPNCGRILTTAQYGDAPLCPDCVRTIGEEALR